MRTKTIDMGETMSLCRAAYENACLQPNWRHTVFSPVLKWQKADVSDIGMNTLSTSWDDDHVYEPETNSGWVLSDETDLDFSELAKDLGTVVDEDGDEIKYLSIYVLENNAALTPEQRKIYTDWKKEQEEACLDFFWEEEEREKAQAAVEEWAERNGYEIDYPFHV